MNLKLKAAKKIKNKEKQVYQLNVACTCKSCMHNQKLHALARIAHYMDFEKRTSLMKAFEISQFNYCPLIWVFYNSTK